MIEKTTTVLTETIFYSDKREKGTRSGTKTPLLRTVFMIMSVYVSLIQPFCLHFVGFKVVEPYDNG